MLYSVFIFKPFLARCTLLVITQYHMLHILSHTMNIPKQSNNKEKASSSISSLSVPTLLDSATELSMSLLQSFSSAAQCAFDIIKSISRAAAVHRTCGLSCVWNLEISLCLRKGLRMRIFGASWRIKSGLTFSISLLNLPCSNYQGTNIYWADLTTILRPTFLSFECLLVHTRSLQLRYFEKLNVRLKAVAKIHQDLKLLYLQVLSNMPSHL